MLLLILIVLGVKGCLDARKNRELSDYARNVSQIAEETEQTSEAFFGKLSEPGDLSVTEFVEGVNADRSAMDNYATRVEGLGAPGDMGQAQNALELVYELRRAAMDEIAEKMSTALGEVGADRATAKIAKEMQTLLGADVLYAQVVRPEIDGVLADNGVEGDDVPKSAFLAEGTSWLDESTVGAALGSVNGSSGGEVSGIHGLGLLGASLNGTELTAESTTAVAAEGTPEVEVRVQNQGEATENGIKVSVSVDGNTLQEEIDTIAASETATVSVPLTPAPTGRVTLEVDVETVPGEQVSENNKASYTVEIE